MINFTDIIKGKFLEEFSAISMTDALTAIALSFLLSLFIVFIYRVTYAGVSYSRNFTGCLMMLSMVTSLVIMVGMPLTEATRPPLFSSVMVPSTVVLSSAQAVMSSQTFRPSSFFLDS